MSDNIGELYALGTAACWTGTALFFAVAGERIGSLVVNFIRLAMALVLLMIVTSVTRGLPVPIDASAHTWIWMSLSGLVGFTFGDLCLFRAFVVLGPRLSTLIMSVAPVLTAAFGWLLLDERLDGQQLLGMTLILAGIAWAVLDRPKRTTGEVRPSLPWAGVALALAGAAGQAGGLVLSKYGMGDFDAFAANEIRVVAGTVGFVIIFFAVGWWPRVREGFKDRRAMSFTAAGAVAGPFLGVSLSLLAVQNTETGVAASIMGITPILVIPFTVFVRREPVGSAGILGALVAVAGVALLFQNIP